MSCFPVINSPRSGGKFTLSELPADAPLPWTSDGAQILLGPPPIVTVDDDER